MPLVTAAVLLLILLGKVQRKRLAILGLTLGPFAFLASLGDAGSRCEKLRPSIA